MAQKRLRSQLVLCNAPSVDSDKARSFYNELFGSEDFVPGPNPNVESFWRPISRDGIDFTITQRYDDQDVMTCYFAVDDLDGAVSNLTSLGGELIQGSLREIPPADNDKGKRGERFGRMAIMLDPDKNHVGLMEIAAEQPKRHFRQGKHQRLLEDDQIEDIEKGKKRSKR